MLRLIRKPVGEYQTNCYLLATPAEDEAILIDPGDEAEALLAWVEGFAVKQVLLTHGHEDHTGALAALCAQLGVPFGVHPADAERFGLKPDFDLLPEERVALGSADLEVVHIPGHTPGSVALRMQDGCNPPRALVGDAIFPGGPGHTDSPQDLQQSLDALERTVFTWPDETVLHPGHGAETTVGAERPAFERFIRSPLPPDLCGDVAWG